ncbi:hypothetical protein [Sedimentitalea todarodis]|uniref:Uncharacterized protein n=1 Tax=Sedimentitalea todarodis TaxID=1631240 RepID=A0ABU3VLL9_9RHOB|nr:hypothetical protein [Sedimentitalea todarodis]MDU9007088.1 hypothetical protein [Sedimentitalea todarodis]
MAAKANSEFAEFLDAPLGDPVFTAERITWLRGAPVTHAKLYFCTRISDDYASQIELPVGAKSGDALTGRVNLDLGEASIIE